MTSLLVNKRSWIIHSGGIIACSYFYRCVTIILQTSFGLNVGWGFHSIPWVCISFGNHRIWSLGLSLLGVFEVPIAMEPIKLNEMSRKGRLVGIFSHDWCFMHSCGCDAMCLRYDTGTGIGFAFTLPPAGDLTLLLCSLRLRSQPSSHFFSLLSYQAFFKFLPSTLVHGWIPCKLKSWDFSTNTTHCSLAPRCSGVLSTSNGGGHWSS